MSALAGQAVGSLVIEPIVDGVAHETAREILVRPGFEGDPWLAHENILDDDGRLEFTMGGYLVRTGDRKVLIDAGVGTIDNGKYRGGALLESLAAVGVAPEEITDVLFTHLHFDHVGWATSKGQIVFPNATYRCHAADWAHFIETPDAAPGGLRKLSPLTPQLELFDTDHVLAPGISVRHAPGHTPGSIVIVVSDGDDRAMLIGDVAHCPAELSEDEWEAVFDVDRALARRTREALARELEGSGIPVAAAHFPGLSFGRILPGQGQRYWTYDLGA